MAGTRPRKRFGQHFLKDQAVVQKIIAAIHPSGGDVMVEVGPGTGVLTRSLLKVLSHLHVIEIDRDLAKTLRQTCSAERLTVHEEDALSFDFGRYPQGVRVVGNLPYNISTPLLFHLARYPQITDCCFMLQKEVVERMVAHPSTAHYGRLSVMLQYRFNMKLLFTVAPDAFYPPPRVESAVVSMTPFRPLPYPAKDELSLELVVASAFGKRRKTLRNALAAQLCEDDWARLGINPGLRAENLSVEDYVRMADFLRQRAPRHAAQV